MINVHPRAEHTTKIEEKYGNPQVIIAIKDNVNYLIRNLSTQQESVIHYNRLKPYYEASKISQPPISGNLEPSHVPPVKQQVLKPTSNTSIAYRTRYGRASCPPIRYLA